jgi:hypothetical protein
VTRAEEIAAAVAEVTGRMAAAAARAGRDPAAARLVTVTKTQPVELIREAIAAGAADLGENRVQDAIPKMAALAAEGARPRWHLIGHLQSNKAKLAAAHFDMVHSVDSAHLAGDLSRHAIAANRTVDLLLQVNVSGEDTKSGVEPRGLPALLDHAAACAGIRVRGLMTMAPLVDDPEDVRGFFRDLRLLAEAAWQDHPEIAAHGPPELSMGMTNDFEVAVEEGATLVRIGSAIFGAR